MPIRDYDEVKLRVSRAVAAVSKDDDAGKVVVSIDGLPGECVHVSLGQARAVTLRVELTPDVATELGEVIRRNGSELNRSH